MSRFRNLLIFDVLFTRLMLVAIMMIHPQLPSGGTSLTLFGFPVGAAGFPLVVSLPFFGLSISFAISRYRESLIREHLRKIRRLKVHCRGTLQHL